MAVTDEVSKTLENLSVQKEYADSWSTRRIWGYRVRLLCQNLAMMMLEGKKCLSEYPKSVSVQKLGLWLSQEPWAYYNKLCQLREQHFA